MKKTIAVILAFLVLVTMLVSCEHFVPAGEDERPSLPSSGEGTAPAGGTEATDGTEPAEENHGFTVFPEGNYLADPMFDTDEYLPDYDVDLSSVHRFSTLDNLCSTETTVYSIRNGLDAGSSLFITYMDKATGISLPLCGKPECMHNDGNCNANVNRPRGLCVYDGKLYWQDYGQVMRMNLDGTEREKVCYYSDYGSNLVIVFHRGYVYYTSEKNDIKDGKAGNRVRVCALPLAGGDPIVLLDRFVDGGVASSFFAATPKPEKASCSTARMHRREPCIPDTAFAQFPGTAFISTSVGYPVISGKLYTDTPSRLERWSRLWSSMKGRGITSRRRSLRATISSWSTAGPATRFSIATCFSITTRGSRSNG